MGRRSKVSLEEEIASIGTVKQSWRNPRKRTQEIIAEKTQCLKSRRFLKGNLKNKQGKKSKGEIFKKAWN